MPNLVIRFIFEPGLVAKLIGYQTDSLWCHTEALSRDGQSWIGAHSGTGVQARPLDWVKPTRERRYSVPVTQEQHDLSMAWLEGKEGMPYDYTDILGMTLHKRIGASDHEIICSALMTEYMMHAGLWPLNCLEGYAYLITPEALHMSQLFLNRCIYTL